MCEWRLHDCTCVSVGYMTVHRRRGCCQRSDSRRGNKRDGGGRGEGPSAGDH